MRVRDKMWEPRVQAKGCKASKCRGSSGVSEASDPNNLSGGFRVLGFRGFGCRVRGLEFRV